MALSANSIFEVRTAGNDTNGGGFVSGASGTDYSQQDAKNTVGADISTTDGVGNGTTTFTSALGNFGTTIVGNIIYLQGGTGSLAAGRYQVTARASTTSITLDRSVAAGTGITMNIGGAVLSLGILGSLTATILVTNNIIYIKAGTYSVTSATANISGGCFSTTAAGIFIEGYQTTRGDLGTKPLIQASGISTFTLINIAVNNAHRITNLRLDGAGLASSKGIAFRGLAYRVQCENFTDSAVDFSTLTVAIAIQCSATGCSSQPAFNNVNCINCVAFNNTITGFSTSATCYWIRCIADSNSGASSDGFVSTATGVPTAPTVNCIAYNNGRDGFRITATRGGVLVNNIAETNAGTGFNVVNVDGIQLNNNAGFNNTSGNFSLGSGKAVINFSSVAGAASFFTDAPNQDFSLNDNASGGLLARATGIPGLMPDISSTGYVDIGAIQHQDPAGGGGGEFSSVF